jgi:glycosyltransferase involved in cell wall biosynthesis
MPACLHIIKNAQPECTGIVRIVTCLARHSERFGYNVSVLFLGDGPLIEPLREAGIRASAIPWSASRSDLAGAWRVWQWLRKNPAAIVHVHHGGTFVRILCRMAGAQAVVQHLHSRILEPDGGSISQLSFRGADAVVACSQAVADCVRESRPEVIYSGVETGSDPPASPDCVGPLIVGVLTRLIPLKNVEATIKAAACLAEREIEICVEIAGTGPSEPALRELATSLKVDQRVRFLGWQTDIHSLLKRWDVLVVSSLEEGLPVSVLEAMAAARPVVASRIGGLGELVVDGVTGTLLAPNDTDALLECLANLARDRRNLISMGREGWKRAHEHFSAEVMARRTTELYDRLLNRKV